MPGVLLAGSIATTPAGCGRLRGAGARGRCCSRFARPELARRRSGSSCSSLRPVSLFLQGTARRLRRERDALANAAFSDPLTGVANRRLLMSTAEHEIARHRRADERFTLVMLDLDGFKLLNDRYGHAAGDQMLRDVAVGLSRALRSQDTVARLGGDEFCVIAPQTGNPATAGRQDHQRRGGMPPAGHPGTAHKRRPGGLPRGRSHDRAAAAHGRRTAARRQAPALRRTPRSAPRRGHGGAAGRLPLSVSPDREELSAWYASTALHWPANVANIAEKQAVADSDRRPRQRRRADRDRLGVGHLHGALGDRPAGPT